MSFRRADSPRAVGSSYDRQHAYEPHQSDPRPAVLGAGQWRVGLWRLRPQLGRHGAAAIARQDFGCRCSRSVNGGATLAAHAQHVRYGLSLMNRWAKEAGNPFADAKWDEAWKVAAVNSTEWDAIRSGLRQEATDWLHVLKTPRQVADIELTGMVGSVAHLAYHLGAIRQINKDARGPKEGTF